MTVHTASHHLNSSATVSVISYFNLKECDRFMLARTLREMGFLSGESKAWDEASVFTGGSSFAIDCGWASEFVIELFDTNIHLKQESQISIVRKGSVVEEHPVVTVNGVIIPLRMSREAELKIAGNGCGTNFPENLLDKR